MKILLAHNYYGFSAPSGENQVFDAERSLLTHRGHTIREFIRHSDEIRDKGIGGILKGALATPWNPVSASSIRCAVESFHPDVVHVHNTFPLLSPSIFHAIGSRTARVLTLHNYRLFCASAIPMRNRRVCTECLDKQSVLPALMHGCYRGSRLATLPLATNIALHRFLGTWINEIDAFIVLTDFQREWMVKAGLPRKLIYVKPNFFYGNPEPVPWELREDAAVFVGRLSHEKGVEHLIDAWLAWGADAPELLILGEGPLREKLSALVRNKTDVRVRFLGQMGSSETIRHIARARLLILPSICFEGFPMVIREAFAFGTPAAVSDIGPLPTIVHNDINGVVFTPGNSSALLEKVRNTWSSGDLERLAMGARAEFIARYTEDKNYEILMDIYARAEAYRRSRH